MPISFVANQTTLGAGGTSINLAAPAGLNGTRLDLLIGAANADNTSTVMTVGPDGTAYTVEVQAIASGGAGDWANILVARKTGAGTPGPVNVTWGGLYPSKWAMGARMAFSGVDLASPVDAESASLATGTINNVVNPVFTVPGISTVTAGAMVIAYVVAASGSDPTNFSTPAGGWTKVMEGSPFWNNYSICMAVFRKTMGAPGPAGDVVTTRTHAGGSLYGWGGGMIALKPDAAAPVTPQATRVNFLGL